MKPKNFLPRTFFALALFASLWAIHLPALGQTSDEKEPIMGTWKLIPEKSSLNRGGPGAAQRPLRPAIWVFAIDGDGFRMSEYNGDSATGTPALSYAAKFDGKAYPHPGARDKGEMVTHWRVSPTLIVRMAQVNGKPTEWVTYAVSTDGNTMTSTSWDPETPEYHNVRVFERQK